MASSKAFAWKCSYPKNKNAFFLLYIWLPLSTSDGCTHTNRVEDWTLEVWFHDIKLFPILQAGKHPLKIISMEYQWDSRSLINLNSGMNCKHELNIWLQPSQVLEPNGEFTKCTLNLRQACSLQPSGEENQKGPAIWSQTQGRIMPVLFPINVQLPSSASVSQENLCAELLPFPPLPMIAYKLGHQSAIVKAYRKSRYARSLLKA